MGDTTREISNLRLAEAGRTKDHCLIVGSNRSKSELFMLSTIDIISRAELEQKDSIILIDSDLKLAARTIPTLQKRGYKCYKVTSIDEPAISKLCDALKDEPTTVLIEPNSHLISEFLTQLYTMLIPKRKSQQGVHIFFNNLRNLLVQEQMRTLVCRGRGRGIVITLIIQTFLQLIEQYGEVDSRIIINNCKTLFLEIPALEISKEISRVLYLKPEDMIRNGIDLDYEYLYNLFPQIEDVLDIDMLMSGTEEAGIIKIKEQKSL